MMVSKEDIQTGRPILESTSSAVLDAATNRLSVVQGCCAAESVWILTMSLPRAVAKFINACMVFWLIASAGSALMLSAAGAFYALTTWPEYFPGDPPAADLILEAAMPLWLFIALGMSGAFAIHRAHESSRAIRLGRRVVASLAALSVLSLAPVVIRVGRRHFGEWAGLQRLLRENEIHALSLIGRKGGGQFSASEFEMARSWFEEHPVYFKFRAMRDPVKVRMMSTQAPFVGVDFGDGQNAVFDLRTMICTYAD